MKIRIGKFIIQSYPIKEEDIPKKWNIFERKTIFGIDFAIWTITDLRIK